MVKRLDEADQQSLDNLISMHPIGRIADPEEIAYAVVWLLSDKALAWSNCLTKVGCIDRATTQS